MWTSIARFVFGVKRENRQATPEGRSVLWMVGGSVRVLEVA